MDHVIEMAVDDEEIVKRITGRRTHLPSGRVYHLEYQPPKQAGRDDLTGEALTLREDDREEIIRKRLEVYHHQTEPLIAYYRSWAKEASAHRPSFHRVNGAGDVHAIFNQIIVD